jgi:predicted metalloprotease with PDZ domain
VGDVRWNGPADKAQLAPGMKIIGVNGQLFSGDALKQAIDDAKGTSKPIHLITAQESDLGTVDIDYHDGQRYPALKRMEGQADLLDEITKPLSPATVLPKAEEKSSN